MDAILEVLCDPARLSEVMTVPPGSNLTLAEVSQAMCSDSGAQSAQVIQNLYSLGAITLQVWIVGWHGDNKICLHGNGHEMSRILNGHTLINLHWQHCSSSSRNSNYVFNYRSISPW
jgi:hypothetical protein